MRSYLNKHLGEKCYIAANGPSLNDIKGEWLSDGIVFGLNRGYLKEDLDINYLVVVNDLVEKQFGTEIMRVNCYDVFSNSLPNSVQLKWTSDVPSFNPTPTTAPSWQGHTVTFVALQLAYEMGFKEVYIVGLDHFFSYKESERGGRGVVTKTVDVNHFDPNYFGAGVRWDPANLRMSEIAYKLADNAFRNDGRKIYNASTRTALPDGIFEPVKLWE